jgi:hypothetical protein
MLFDLLRLLPESVWSSIKYFPLPSYRLLSFFELERHQNRVCTSIFGFYKSLHGIVRKEGENHHQLKKNTKKKFYPVFKHFLDGY